MVDFVTRAADLLFPEGGRQTLNVKFFSAADGHINASDLVEQIVRAECQISAGTAVLVQDVDDI